VVSSLRQTTALYQSQQRSSTDTGSSLRSRFSSYSQHPQMRYSCTGLCALYLVLYALSFPSSHFRSVSGYFRSYSQTCGQYRNRLMSEAESTSSISSSSGSSSKLILTYKPSPYKPNPILSSENLKKIVTGV